MARVARVPDAEDLNLTPIMNMVLVLIPLMLLIGVFMMISVTEVTISQGSAFAAQNGEPPKRLQLFISQQGFTVVESGASLPALENCPGGGPTICPLKEEIDPNREVETDRHDWRRLYNTLLEIKQKPDWADHEQIEIVADSSVNFGVLVKAMDVSRNQRVPAAEVKTAIKGKPMTTDQEMNESQVPLVDSVDDQGNSGKMPLGMFPVVILGLPTVSQ